MEFPDSHHHCGAPAAGHSNEYYFASCQRRAHSEFEHSDRFHVAGGSAIHQHGTATGFDFARRHTDRVCGEYPAVHQSRWRKDIQGNFRDVDCAGSHEPHLFTGWRIGSFLVRRRPIVQEYSSRGRNPFDAFSGSESLRHELERRRPDFCRRRSVRHLEQSGKRRNT